MEATKHKRICWFMPDRSVKCWMIITLWQEKIVSTAWQPEPQFIAKDLEHKVKSLMFRGNPQNLYNQLLQRLNEWRFNPIKWATQWFRTETLWLLHSLLFWLQEKKCLHLAHRYLIQKRFKYFELTIIFNFKFLYFIMLIKV